MNIASRARERIRESPSLACTFVRRARTLRGSARQSGRGSAEMICESASSLRYETHQVVRPDSDHIHKANVCKQALRGPLVDRGRADTEQLCDLADGEELLDRR